MGGQTMRDWRRDATYYDQRIHFDEVVLPSFQQSSAEALLPLEKRTMRNRFVASSTISWTNHTTLEWLYRYSRGEDISSLRSCLFCVLATFTESRHRLSLLPTAELGGDAAQLVDSDFALPDYARVLRLVSLGVCLGVGPVWVGAVVGAWPGSPGGHDRLLDRLVASTVSGLL